MRPSCSPRLKDGREGFVHHATDPVRRILLIDAEVGADLAVNIPLQHEGDAIDPIVGQHVAARPQDVGARPLAHRDAQDRLAGAHVVHQLARKEGIAVDAILLGAKDPVDENQGIRTAHDLQALEIGDRLLEPNMVAVDHVGVNLDVAGYRRVAEEDDLEPVPVGGVDLDQAVDRPQQRLGRPFHVIERAGVNKGEVRVFSLPPRPPGTCADRNSAG